MEFQVVLSIRSHKDLTAIGSYIAKDNPERASSFCQELVRYALELKTFPERGHFLHRRRDIQKVRYQRYIIFYKIDKTTRTIEILRFWHAARIQRGLRMREAEEAVYGNELELRRRQVALGEGALILGDEALLQ